MSDILKTHKRLCAGGLSEAQSKDFLRLIVDAENGSAEQQAIEDHFAAANYSVAQAKLLVIVLLERFA